MKQIDSQEADRLVNTYSDLILRLSYTYLHSTFDAEDICQSVLYKYLASGQSFENTDHEKAWIIRATINACKDELRKFHRKTIPLDENVENAAPEVPSSEVLDAVMELPQNYREAIYLFYIEGYSISEIANLLGESKTSVAAHLSRGRKKLREKLERKRHESYESQ